LRASVKALARESKNIEFRRCIERWIHAWNIQRDTTSLVAEANVMTTSKIINKNTRHISNYAK
jgi:hypothetical protein